MFDLIVIVVIAALAFPVLAIVALIKAIGAQRLVRRLELRVASAGAQQALAGTRRDMMRRVPSATSRCRRSSTPPPPPAARKRRLQFRRRLPLLRLHQSRRPARAGRVTVTAAADRL